MLDTFSDCVIMVVWLNLAAKGSATVPCVIWTKTSDGAKAEHGYSQDQMVLKRKLVILNLPESVL